MFFTNEGTTSGVEEVAAANHDSDGGNGEVVGTRPWPRAVSLSTCFAIVSTSLDDASSVHGGRLLCVEPLWVANSCFWLLWKYRLTHHMGKPHPKRVYFLQPNYSIQSWVFSVILRILWDLACELLAWCVFKNVDLVLAKGSFLNSCSATQLIPLGQFAAPL